MPDLKTLRSRLNTLSVGNAAGIGAPTRFRDRSHISQSAINVAVRDAERQRLAREIHDDLGAELTALRYALARIADALPEQLAAACNMAMSDAQAALDAAFQASRRLVDERHVSPCTLDPCKQLQEWVSAFSQRIDLPISFNVKADPRLDTLDTDTGLALLRITQEALNNMAKHAKAHSASVRLSILVSGIQLTIRDDGRGLGAKRASVNGGNNSGSSASGNTAHVTSHGSGSGLHSMRERCEALGGHFELLSRAGTGLEVRAWMPWRGRVPVERRGLPTSLQQTPPPPSLVPMTDGTSVSSGGAESSDRSSPTERSGNRTGKGANS